jgi:hypothetical protein
VHRIEREANTIRRSLGSSHRQQRAAPVESQVRYSDPSMVSLQSALLPEPGKPRPPCLSVTGADASTATSRKRKRDGGDDGQHEDSRGEVVDGIELNFDAAPLPPEWQRCLDIKVRDTLARFIHAYAYDPWCSY